MIIRIWQLPRIVAHERFNYIKSLFYLQPNLVYYALFGVAPKNAFLYGRDGLSPFGEKNYHNALINLTMRRKSCAKLDNRSSRGISCSLVMILRYLRIRKFPTTRTRLHWTDVMLADWIRWYSATNDREATWDEGRVWHGIIIMHDNSLM